jgi:RNA polymerase sigma factor (TIGR02999 family)
MNHDVGEVLRRLAAGEDGALDEIYALVYSDLQRVAHRQLAQERPDHTLNTTGLVHEAYLRLFGSSRIQAEAPSHFLSIAARAMRRVLVDHARRKGADKRGGTMVFETLNDHAVGGEPVVLDLLIVDDALGRLAELDERQAQVVECRVFGGMSVADTAEALGVSPATVKRDWTMARAWLNRELSPLSNRDR